MYAALDANKGVEDVRRPRHKTLVHELVPYRQEMERKDFRVEEVSLWLSLVFPLFSYCEQRT